MGDEPYAALLPWAVFAVIDRAQGGGPLWAGLGALITAIALLLTSSRGEAGPRNVMVLGALGWFGALVVAAALHRSGSGFIVHDGQALSASGFALIAFGSLTFSPAIEHYTRPHVRSSRWDDPAFHRVNVRITLIWGATFTGVALANFVAASIGTTAAYTLFDWVVPLALAAIAAHRSRIWWDDFNDDDLFEPDPMRNLALDWETPPLDER